VSCYGFDYDYTLAIYNDNLLQDIYKDAVLGLVAQGYPAVFVCLFLSLKI